ncbi:MAG: hypothetical protein ACKORJ_01680 [Bacteroidota bacterium]
MESIKPIVYKDIREKVILEEKLMTRITNEKREIVAKAIAEFFSTDSQATSAKNSSRAKQ